MAQPTPRRVAKTARTIKNPDGTYSTERTITIETGAGFVNLPTIYNGEELPDQKAIDLALKTKNHSRPYGTIKEAEMAARRRSGAIGKELSGFEK